MEQLSLKCSLLKMIDYVHLLKTAAKAMICYHAAERQSCGINFTCQYIFLIIYYIFAYASVWVLCAYVCVYMCVYASASQRLMFSVLINCFLLYLLNQGPSLNLTNSASQAS